VGDLLNFSNLVNLIPLSIKGIFAAKGIESVYHKYFEQQQGKEAHPTFYLYRHQNKPYHMDYCLLLKI
jgi:hypothetical protein